MATLCLSVFPASAHSMDRQISFRRWWPSPAPWSWQGRVLDYKIGFISIKTSNGGSSVSKDSGTGRQCCLLPVQQLVRGNQDQEDLQRSQEMVTRMTHHVDESAIAGHLSHPKLIQHVQTWGERVASVTPNLP